MKLDFTEMDQSKKKKKSCMALVLERAHTHRAEQASKHKCEELGSRWVAKWLAKHM